MEYFYMFKQMWKYSGTDKWRIILFMLFHIISMIGLLGQPYAFAMVINTLQKNESSLIQDIMFWLIIYLIGFGVFELFHRSARFLERYTAFRNYKRFVVSMYDHMQGLPLEWHNNNHSGSIIDRINRAASALHAFSESQATYIDVIMRFIIPSIILFSISPVIAIIASLTGIMLVCITRKFYNLTVPQNRNYNEAFHKVAAAFYDYIGNITTIIILRLGNLVKKDINARINKVFPYIVKEHKLTQVKCFINALFTVMLNVGLIFYYIFFKSSNNETIMIGTISMIFSYLGSFMAAFDFYAGGFESVIHWKVDFEATKEIRNAKTIYFSNGSTQIINWNEIIVKIKDFAYETGNFRLKEVSLVLNRGKRIAFVGESGSGKSTVLKLLRGIYNIESGLIVKDKAMELPLSSLECITTLIPQEPEIFENSILYNITMGLDGDDKLIENALNLSQFESVLNILPNGLESIINEKGVNLSGGEKQRLALARGIFSIQDSSLVLLDEPTGSLDPSIEMEIYRGIFECLVDKCIVSVLHRLHMVKIFDYIYVFKSGEIVEEGTFETLLTLNGEFQRLWNNYLVRREKENVY